MIIKAIKNVYTSGFKTGQKHIFKPTKPPQPTTTYYLLTTIFYFLPNTYYFLPTTNYISYNRFLCFFKKRNVITPLDFNRSMNGKFQAASNAKGKGSIPEYLP